MSHISLFESQLRAEEIEASRAKRRRSQWTNNPWSGPAGPGQGQVPTPDAEDRARRPVHVGRTPGGALWGTVLAAPRNRAHLGRAFLASRRISFQPDLKVGIDDEDNEDSVEAVVGPTWTVLRLSPLFGMDLASDFLQQWADSMQHDYNNKRGRTSALAGERVHVTVTTLCGLRGTEDDDEAIHVQMRAVSEGPVLYQAVFLSVDNPKKLSLRSHETNAFIHYPVLLSSGLSELEQLLTESLSKCFDGVVTGVNAAEELRWMIAIWAGLRGGDDDDDMTEQEIEDCLRRGVVKMVLNLPCKEAQTVSIRLKQMQLVNVWKSIHDPKEAHATKEEIEVFHAALCSHLRQSVNLNLEGLSIKKVELPVVTASASGKLKIHSTKHAKTILRFVTELCSICLTTPVPAIGIS